MDKDFIEDVLGGVCAIIAVGAAIAEVVINGVSAATIAAGMKDIFGTLVIILLFFSVIKDAVKNVFCSFEKKMKSSFDNWQKENSNMIVKKVEYDTDTLYGLGLKTDMKHFYEAGIDGANKDKSGLFVRVPIFDKANYNKNEVVITFHLNKGTFFEGRSDMDEAAKNRGFDIILNLLKGHISKESIVKAANAKSTQSSHYIEVVLNGPIKRSDIPKLIELVDKTYHAYLVAANLKVN